MKNRLYDEYIKRLLEVNDETVTQERHNRRYAEFSGWVQGVKDSSGHTFNGDYYYIAKFDSGEMKERPLCCGIFLDWDPTDNR